MAHTYELIQKAQMGDEEAKSILLKENERLIWSVVRRFSGRGDAEDLFQLGAIGLLKCIEKFDFAFDVKFSTYAVPMILGEIRRFLRDDGSVKVSRSLKELASRAKRMQETALKEENRELSLLELSRNLGVETNELILALETGKEVESIYASFGNDDAEGAKRMIDLLADPSGTEKMMERLFLKEALERLAPKEQQIIMMRYFQDRTQMDVAKHMGISQVQVSRIEKKVLLQMREALK